MVMDSPIVQIVRSATEAAVPAAAKRPALITHPLSSTAGAEDGPARSLCKNGPARLLLKNGPARWPLNIHHSSFIIHHSPFRLLLSVLLLISLAAGCRQPFDHYSQTLQAPVPEDLEPPREIHKVSLPAYRVEPPDILSIEMLKMVPRPPYRIETYDVLQIRASGTLWDQPIDNFYLVEAEGVVNLGPVYGTVRVAGMTIEEANETILKKLREILSKPGVSVQLARTAGTQPVSGEYLVGPDGTINLRSYGVVHVAGKSVPEIKVAIQEHLSQFFDSPEVAVDVLGYNSKVFYVITDGAGMGDSVRRIPVTGNETVLDAVAAVGGISQLSSKMLWVARPAPGEFGCEQILPVDYEAITQGGSASTNYQLLPGDRVFIAQDNVIGLGNTINKFTAPVERLLGISGLGASTVRGFQTLGRNYNRQRYY
jgi:polysaccharide export outer membrane protein